MRSTLTIRNATTALSGVILIGLALSGAAYAISSAAFRYSTPQTGYLMIPPAAFVPVVENVHYGREATLDTIGTGCFVAPVNLPQGAKLTHLAVWYGNSDAGPVSLLLLRGDVSDDFALVAELPMANTGGVAKSAGVKITDPSVQRVNNARFGYFLDLCLRDTTFLRRARITYAYGTAGD